MDQNTYPAAPASPADVSVSPDFRKQAAKVIASIFLFCCVYLVLVTAVLALASAAIYYGFFAIMTFPRWITILLGSGMIATGVSLIFFVMKFIGSVSKNQNDENYEITEQDHPRLFEFLRKLSVETDVPFPKKVLLSSEVNAAVFYDSSFLSMFLPIKKNLLIGLGLVNSVNISEFKAVIAHEFGHFSQRSMKVGSFIYTVNRVIYNMLYENTTYVNFLSRWASLHGLLSVFALITIKISVFIQWVLRGMYALTNKRYMALSRQMEFHADAIAASISGGNNLISALARLKFAEGCFQGAVLKANNLISEKKQLENIFSGHRLMMKLVAGEHKISVNGNLPDVPYEFAASSENSRITVKNQWASHPTLKERKKNLDILHVVIPPNMSSPWELFDDPTEVQKLITRQLYETVKFDGEPGIIDADTYKQMVLAKMESKRLPAAYNGFYNGRYFDLSDEEIDDEDIQTERSFADIFSEDNGRLQTLIESCEIDLETVEAIHEKKLEVKSFDFDGNKFSVVDCPAVISQLKADLERLKKKQKDQDRDAFTYFCQNVADPAPLRNRYRKFLEDRRFIEDYKEHSAEIRQIFWRISETMSIEQAGTEAARLKELDKTVIVPTLAEMIEKKMINQENNEELFKSAEAFVGKDYHYFFDDAFIENEMSELYNLNDLILPVLEQYLFTEYKSLLEYQLTAVPEPATVSSFQRQKTSLM